MKFDLRPKDVPASYYGKGDKFFNFVPCGGERPFAFRPRQLSVLFARRSYKQTSLEAADECSLLGVKQASLSHRKMSTNAQSGHSIRDP